MKSKFSELNEKIFSSTEISGFGAIGRIKLLRGKLFRFTSFFGRFLSYTSTRSYGCFLLSFGIMSLLLNLGEYYFREQPQVSVFSLAAGAALAVLALPLFIVDKPMCTALQEFLPTDKLLFDFFLIKRMHKDTEHISVPPLVALFLGFIPAVIGFFVPLRAVVCVLGIAIIVAVSFTTPEFQLVLTLVALPYVSLLPHSVTVLCSMSVLTFLSFAVKVLLGKRVFRFDIYDVIICLSMLFILIGGAVGYGDDSFKNSLVAVALLLGYFSASNLLVNRRITDCAVNAVSVSAVPVTVISIADAIIKLHNGSLRLGNGESGVSVFFSTPAANAAFLTAAAVCTLTLAIEKHKILTKVIHSFIFLSELAALALIMQPAVWITAAIAAVAYLTVRSHILPADVLALLIAIPHAALPLLVRLDGLLGAELGISEKLLGYKAAFGVFTDNVWLGTGIGRDSYIIASGGDGGGIFNTLLGIASELGVFALALFVVMILLRLRNFSYYKVHLKSSPVYVTGNMSLVATVALLSFGAFGNIFSDVSVACLFWIIFGIGSAALKTAKKEYDDRLSYYGDSRSSEFSALDIGIIN